MEEKLKNSTSSLYEITETIAGLDSLLSYLKSISDTATLNASPTISQCTVTVISDVERLKAEVESLKESKIIERRGMAMGLYKWDAHSPTSTR